MLKKQLKTTGRELYCKIIEKLKSFFEKYFGIGGSSSFFSTDNAEESFPNLMAAEKHPPYTESSQND